jgi:alkylation response protein AidB-like acyl-CoA dehydrogenase
MVPAYTPGLTVEATHHLVGALPWEAGHLLVRYDGVRVSAGCSASEHRDSRSRNPGSPGAGLHRSMRAIGVAQRAIEMMATPAKSRFTQGGSPADKQLVQAFIADSYAELMPFRLAVLHAAWLIDTAGEHAARAEIAACKILAARVVQSTALWAIQVHGALGITDQMPLTGMLPRRAGAGSCRRAH